MKPNHKRKHIAYAYPSSTNAEHFGMGDTGCYYIEQTISNIEGSGQCSSGIHPQADSEGFLVATDPDLQSLYQEVDGERHSSFEALHPEYYPESNRVETLSPGCGYWDITAYGIGGCFRRVPRSGDGMRIHSVADAQYEFPYSGSNANGITDDGRRVAFNLGYCK